MAQERQGLHLPKIPGGCKNTGFVKRQLLKVLREVAERVDNLEDAEALLFEVNRAFVHNLINKDQYEELSANLFAVIEELKGDQ